MVAGHEPEGVVDVLAPLAARVYATQPTWTKGLPAEAIAQAARAACPDVRIAIPPHEAARQALAAAGPEDIVVVTGSFYVVGDVNPAEFA
jgi:dihydrofolate synthase/folylpolyglutamate synthase